MKILSKEDLSLIESLLDKAVEEMKGEERERGREGETERASRKGEGNPRDRRDSKGYPSEA